MAYPAGSSSTGWRKRKAKSSMGGPSKKFKRSTYKKNRKPFYQRTVTFDDSPEEMKRHGRKVSLVLDHNGTGATATVDVKGNAPLEQINTGEKALQRIGNQVNIKGLKVRGFIRNKTGNDKTMLVRLIWFYNRRIANGDIAGTSPMFLSQGQPVAMSDIGMDGIYLPTNNQHYSIKSDRVFKIGSSTDSGDNVFILNQTFALDHIARWDNGTGANINYGNLQCMAISFPSDGLVTSDSNVNLVFDASVYYTE